VFFTRAFATPGHIGDQICFAIKGDQRIIVGDTLFNRCIYIRKRITC